MSQIPRPVCNLFPFCSCLQNFADNEKTLLLLPNCPGLQQYIEQQQQRAAEVKAARNKRKIARQQSLGKSTQSPGTSSPSSPNLARTESKKRLSFDGDGSGQGNDNPDCMFVMINDKKLRVLMKKELTNCDVGNHGRIVLPKKEAEENLPVLTEREGIPLVIRDVYFNINWTLKFKYWINNKSRMYILEDTGDFVKENEMELGDSLILYEDESKNLYFTVKKREETKRYRARSEEEATFALLIQQLQETENQEHSLASLSFDFGVPPPPFNIAPPPPAAAGASASSNNDSGNDMVNDDFYTGVELLNGFPYYNFSL